VDFEFRDTWWQRAFGPAFQFAQLCISDVRVESVGGETLTVTLASDLLIDPHSIRITGVDATSRGRGPKVAWHF